jgi:hypothetical protein
VRRCRRALIVALSAAATSAVAAPASADVAKFEDHSGPFTETYDCGAVLVFTLDENGRAIFNGEDEFVRFVEQFTFSGTITYQGRTYRDNDHQTETVWVSRDDELLHALNGQGFFTNFPGLGHIFDVGHLVFTDDTGQTVRASAKAVGIDEPFDVGAEVCAILAA